MTEPYSFLRHQRQPKTVMILTVIYAGLIALVILFNAAWWIMAGLALFTLPTLWDLATDAKAGLTLDNHVLSWFSGRRSAEVRLDEIDYLRFDTRWDFSVRVTVYLTTDKRVRLPYDSLPPHRTFEEVLQAHGLRVERHHFTIL
ncbi:hypothetical protein TRL7639_01477 [Falsiruegeria litorea R37]|uniref:Uncharacterized protein n=1 Tax=Falsiruegeria litorea R37 TaxID=1200284 RepID=A0A1Y5S647_9RHOB|nr:hypothetical protein [Falsiruegeria litorea]SLN33451.1 hypothetical protein TRL7639_01477 [Falsiruegeria litorea R37]